VSASKRDPRRTELDKYLDAYRKLALPEGNAFEQAVWCVLARNGTRESASKALATLWTRYVDVNELRVAQVDEVARLIVPHVKNDADRVAALTRAFLRAIVRGQHQMSFDFVEEMTLAELRKFLGELGDRASDVALAMLIHFCRAELEAEVVSVPEVPEEEDAPRPRKKGERDLTPIVDRLRLLFTVAGYGHAEGKGQPATLVRRVAKLLDYAALPPRPVEEPRRAPAVPALDDDEGPDDQDLADAESDGDLDDDLEDLDGDYDEDGDFEGFDDEEEGGSTRKGGGKRKTRRTGKTGRRSTGGPKTSGRSAKKKTSTGRTSGARPATKKATPRKSTARKSGAKSTGKSAGKTARAQGSGTKGTGSRGAGATRPRTARKPARKSPTARKSSRRR